MQGGLAYRIRSEATNPDPPTIESDLSDRITVGADIFNGKPVIRDMRLTFEHVLGKPLAGHSAETVLSECPFVDPSTSGRVWHLLAAL